MMKDKSGIGGLVGRCFALADGRYRIVDVRRLGDDAMVYAESTAPGADMAGNGMRRAAFRMRDVAPLLEARTSDPVREESSGTA